MNVVFVEAIHELPTERRGRRSLQVRRGEKGFMPRLDEIRRGVM